MTTKTKKTISLVAIILTAIVTIGLITTTSVTAQSDVEIRNYEAQVISEELMKLKAVSLTGGELSEAQQARITELEKQLEESVKKFSERFDISSEELNELKSAQKLISDSEVPTTLLGIDQANKRIIIQLLDEDKGKYESKIARILGNTPHVIDYGEGFKRGACASDDDDCSPIVGGLRIQVKTTSTTANNCTLAIPMEQDGVDGFLTAGHCFNGYDYTVYQPDATQPSDDIGSSSASNVVFEDDIDCDCAWIDKDTATASANGVFAWADNYFVINGVDTPSVSDFVYTRGATTSEWNNAGTIAYDNVEATQGGITTTNTMLFPAEFAGGDSGGPVFGDENFVGIAVGEVEYMGTDYVVFVPWDHVNGNYDNDLSLP